MTIVHFPQVRRTRKSPRDTRRNFYRLHHQHLKLWLDIELQKQLRNRPPTTETTHESRRH